MPNIGLDKDKLKPVAEALNKLLADYQVYYQTLRNFHWNLRGRKFFILHEKFEEMYESAHDEIDEIAERLLMIGFRPASTFQEYAKIASLQETTEVPQEEDMVKYIAQQLQTLIGNMRTVLEAAGDASDEGTIDLIAGQLADNEKLLWMTSAWLADSE